MAQSSETKRGHAKGLAADAYLIIEVVRADGKPLEPTANASKFVHQCGVVVRDNVPISIQEWNEPKNLEGASWVSNRTKDVLWDKVIAKFTLPVLDSTERTQAMTKKVKHFALKKMAEQFNKYKNRLYHDWQSKKKAPDFTGTLERQRPHWKAFLEYKESERAKERSKKNTENAAKKIYHHKMGAGGYISAEPKWDKIEAELRNKGITPITENWPHRVRNWMLAHGAEYDMETGDLIVDEKKETPIPRKQILDALADAREGKFIPDRENDELTKVCYNYIFVSFRVYDNHADQLDIDIFLSRPSVIKKKEDEHEAVELCHGMKGFLRTVNLIEAEQEQRRGRSRRNQTG